MLPVQLRDAARAIAPMAIYGNGVTMARLEFGTLDDEGGGD